MKKSTLAILLTSSLLAACGGSGGSDNAQTSDPQNPSTPLPEQPNTPTPSSAYMGKTYIVPVNSSAPTQTYNTTSNSIATLTANGQELAVQLPGIISGGFTQLTGNTTYNGKSYSRFIVSGTRYVNSKFGYITEGQKDYIFSHGAPTANMPASGRVEYDGDALIGKAGSVSVADADFVADFGQKTLTGSITRDSQSTFAFNPIAINATISGNTFAANNGAITSSGYFYGNNAAEIGGVFSDSSQGIAGSFGARKDD